LLGWAERGPASRPTHTTVVAAQGACAAHATGLAHHMLDRGAYRYGYGLRTVAVTGWPLPEAAAARAYGAAGPAPSLLGGPVVNPQVVLPPTAARPAPPPVRLALRRTSDRDVQEVVLHGRTYRLVAHRDGRRGRIRGYSVLDATAPGPYLEQRRAEGGLRECRSWLEAVARGEDPPPRLEQSL
jgi:hypothetical protein